MKTVVGLVMVCAVVLASGCATTYPIGQFYTEVTLPVLATANAGAATKVGTAQCVSYFALFTKGDASIETAKKNGGITKVHHIDWDVKNILGYGKYKVTVYGE